MAPKSVDFKLIEKISKALSDKHRLAILDHITRQGGCAQCSDIHDIVDLSQPSVSHHIKILTEAGLVDAEKTGRNISYTLNTKVLSQYMKFLNDLRND